MPGLETYRTGFPKRDLLCDGVIIWRQNPNNALFFWNPSKITMCNVWSPQFNDHCTNADSNFKQKIVLLRSWNNMKQYIFSLNFRVIILGRPHSRLQSRTSMLNLSAAVGGDGSNNWFTETIINSTVVSGSRKRWWVAYNPPEGNI